MELYRTNAGNLVLAATWMVDAKDGESLIRVARVVEDRKGLQGLLEDFNPFEYIPPGYDGPDDRWAVGHAFRAAISRLISAAVSRLTEKAELYETVE